MKLLDDTAPASGTAAGGTWRGGVLMFGPPMVLLALVVTAGAMLWQRASDEQSGAIGHMRDICGEVSAHIAATASQGLAKTKSLANDPRLAPAIAAGDRAGAEQLANDLLRSALELDIVAIFDADGGLLAVNTVDHAGAPVAQSALDSIYGADFSQRGVVQSCLRDTTVEARMEFQTECDFTPPFFGSSGLSVAFSAPAHGPDGVRAGVVSTRLNFERVKALVHDNSFVKAGNRVHLVSDTGEFFDEAVNSGRVAAPLTREQVRASVSPGVRDGTGEVTVRRDGLVLMGRRVGPASTMDGGGMHVLLSASERWVHAEQARAMRLAGGMLLGSVLAAVVWCLFLAARAKQMRAQAALSAERSRTALILENVGECVLSAGPHGRVEFANRAANRALLKAAGLRLGDLFADGAPQTLTGAWRTDRATMRRGDGTTFPARVTCTVLPEGAGVVVAFSDLTEKLETDRKLLDATRRAGMAEVATGVLHNVGNVLNSVNVAACVVASKLKQSEIPNLVRAGGMLEENKGHLAEYLSDDERGRHLPEYLIEVAKTLGAEQRSMLDELEAVTKGIDHVKHVVSLQQEHAKNSSVAELIRPQDLMETAIQLQLDTLAKNGITVERRYEELPCVMADKHLVLQILVNLIANARHAIIDNAGSDRRLIVGAGLCGAGADRQLRLEVIDSGVGIPRENLSRIFGQGFTTKKDGHGFGLHSAANAAAQMGGSLSATSDGPGRGARFVLLIPVAPRPAALAA